MTHPGSGNPTWQGWPNTQTPISALALENIESTLDNLATGEPITARSAWSQSGATAASGTKYTLSGLTAVAAMQDSPATMTSGVVRLNASGTWSLTLVANTDNGSAHYTMIAMEWPNGAWSPLATTLADKSVTPSGFPGGGGIVQTLHWCGRVSAAQAAQPITLTILAATANSSSITGAAYSFLAERHGRPAT